MPSRAMPVILAGRPIKKPTETFVNDAGPHQGRGLPLQEDGLVNRGQDRDIGNPVAQDLNGVVVAAHHDQQKER